MQFAVGLPNVGEYADPHVLVGLAVLAEAAGWDGVFCWDHVSRGGEPATDPQVALAAMAAATSRVRLGAMVTPLARRRPTKVARETVALDRLSNGRLVVGVGLGSRDDEEFGAFGDEREPSRRAAVLDEALDVVTALWSGQPVSFHGAHVHVATPGFLPTPVQRPRPPLWVAARWPARPGVRRAARYDGVFLTFADVVPGRTAPPELLAQAVAYAREHRDPQALALDVAIEACSPTAAPVGRYADAGLTWWVEALGPWRAPLAALKDVVAAGPPTA